MALSLEPTDVAPVVREAWELVRHRAARLGVTLIEDQAMGCDVRVTADRQRLKQVVVNLLSNAVKYNRDNGTVRVTCTTGTTGSNRLRIAVTDTGRGIPEEALNRLFVPFERLGAEQTGIEGTGIGLAVSRGLVEAMGGEIGVETTHGQGSTFWFELPMDAAIPVPPLNGGDGTGPVEVETEVTFAPADVSAATVLYIEDNPSNYKLVERLLVKRPGVKLLTAMKGGNGLEMARQTRPDLILLDLHLPDMHGAEVLRRIREDSALARTPVVIISADVTRDQADDLVRSGARAYLPKPMDVQAFLRIVDDVLA
jgi:CheY-like chemotaxis protein